jgi:hypothetical protein
MIVGDVTVAFRRGILEHILNSRPKCALFTKAATLDADTQRYSPENEVQGEGYQAGGMELEGGTILPGPDGGLALVFHSPVWKVATVNAYGAVIYLADDAGRTVRIICFEKNVISTNGPFTVKLAGAADGGVVTA